MKINEWLKQEVTRLKMTHNMDKQGKVNEIAVLELLNTLSIIAFIVLILLLGYTVGSLYGNNGVVSEREVMNYITSRDEGCDQVVRYPNDELVCEVTIQEEDEAVFVIRKPGSHDNY